ncbi:hypothetical protein BDV59DRAFT_167092 [Aspergillus ambiguus]|uniref:uncharacterized protein n=1 Tax=Aspergillus ambiguus TaxID=176160 RepID=UPI003CCDFB3F
MTRWMERDAKALAGCIRRGWKGWNQPCPTLLFPFLFVCRLSVRVGQKILSLLALSLFVWCSFNPFG